MPVGCVLESSASCGGNSGGENTTWKCISLPRLTAGWFGGSASTGDLLCDLRGESAGAAEDCPASINMFVLIEINSNGDAILYSFWHCYVYGLSLFGFSVN